MTTSVQGGPLTVRLSRDAAMIKAYKVTHLVLGGPGDGPATVLATPGLPQIGDAWNFGTETDVWAWCRPEAEVAPVVEREGNYWTVENTFSTAPWQRPNQPAGDPLLEPPKISISFSKTTEEITVDRFGRPVTNSCHEQLRGKHVEFDSGTVAVKVEQNLAALNFPDLAAAYQTVNAFPLWGMPRRTIKLDNASVEVNYYGPASVFYKRSLEFSANARGWDRDLLDEGTKVLHGRWRSAVLTPGSGSGSGSGVGAGGTGLTWELTPVDAAGTMPDPYNPTHYLRFTDFQGNPARVILNGQGVPAGTVAALRQQFVAVSPVGNTGRSLSDSNYWVPIKSPPAFVTWTADDRYRRGDLVIDDASRQFVALTANRGSPSGPLANPDVWLQLFSFTDRGLYNAAVTYSTGDYVVDSTLTAAGVVHVERYAESDFGLLGIPLVL